MTYWFVSRHQGAVAWARARKLPIDRFVPHLNVDDVLSDDTVMGTLPVELAAEVCRRGARFYALCMTVDEARRGHDLTAGDLAGQGACLQRYHVIREEDDDGL